MYYISDMSKKNISKIIFGLKPLTTDHADRFPSSWGWFRSFQPPLGAYTQRNNENLYINFRLLSLHRPYFVNHPAPCLYLRLSRTTVAEIHLLYGAKV